MFISKYKVKKDITTIFGKISGEPDLLFSANNIYLDRPENNNKISLNFKNCDNFMVFPGQYVAL